MGMNIFYEFSCDTLPREKLGSQGPAALSDRELLAVILGSGIKGRNVNTIAGELASRLCTENGSPSLQELRRIPGMGFSKACSISAMLEFGRRKWGNRNTRIKSPGDVFPLIRHLADRKQERFISMSLNGAHEVQAVRVVTVGLVNRTQVHPREVFADPLQDRACAVIVAHNHPSGILLPSGDDDDITWHLVDAANTLGMQLLDHVVFSESGYYSYQEHDKFKE
jgi:DNA repair protein RadC